MNDLVKKIKGYGYWRILIRSNKFDAGLISSIADARQIIEDNKVVLRGWDYPHSDRELKTASEDSIESVCNWDAGPFYEYWRYYLSGQFLQYFAMREDCRIDVEGAEKIKSRIFFPEGKLDNVKSFLGILSTLYTFTEVFFFASRLSQNGNLGEDSIHIEIALHKVKDRMLYVEDVGRDLHRPYVCSFAGDKIVMTFDLNRSDLISNYAELALDNTIKLFGYFNWENPSKQILEEDQRKFLERRL